MPIKFSTSPDGYALIKRFEGCKLKAYKPTPASNWTVGWGQEGLMPDGRLVTEGLVITQQEADDALQYFVRNVVDPLVRKHFVVRAQHEHDACASWIYNIRHDRLERGDYSLPQLVNSRDRDEDALISLWLRYVRTPGAENGLYRRRIAEVILFLGLPWQAPAVLGFLSNARFMRNGQIQPDDPHFIIDAARAASGFVTQEPDPPAMPKPIAPVEITPLEPLPSPIDPTLPPKKIEESRTGRAVNRASRGRETAGIGGIGAVLVLIAQQIEAIDRSVQNLSPDTVFRVALFGAVALAGIGIYWWWSGRTEAYHRRQIKQDPKY